MKSIKCKNKHQHKLIVLISTINYMNLNLKRYTQSDILYYFNKNMKKNGYNEIKLKTLQNYLYKLEKAFKVTNNYYRHLGINMGTEVHYELKYSKKECYRIINKHFRDKKEIRHKNRINTYLKNEFPKNRNVEKGECTYNTYNKKEDKNKTKYIERLQIKKYAKKSKIKPHVLSSVLNLNLSKKAAFEIFKATKKDENESKRKAKNRIKTKQKHLKAILKHTKNQLITEGYCEEELTKKINVIYDKYQHKPHFIIQNSKYNDLDQITKTLKKSVERIKESNDANKKDIRNNVFSILLDQLRHKASNEVLIPILKDYLNKQNELHYGKVFNNYYYYDLINIIERGQDYSEKVDFEKITS
ncbi:hypothetical protein bcCo53_000857 (plasmid) [Borrelia coriaceae]|uniref:Uncharacterized protein n=1 Tax=Borrelia coriaceae ATCC 43381 TaxID=1408429 RepID=W5SYH2_9SPIR|nr:plasmid maintenance protein [Borrelia coriaceae]AHH11768.1 Hypothetical protein BCO_0129709 [Borrelia coriaceae ATCC 43381]UPA16693.1 hypothetical protein bcCo53_000857 [Borrelia coriaceae]